MRELVQINSVTEHACEEPAIERWHVYEPVSARWSWMRVFGCCDLVIVEPGDEEQDKVKIKRAA